MEHDLGKATDAILQSYETGGGINHVDGANLPSKRAAGRPKDFEPIAELEAIRQERLSGRTDFLP